ncbi:MAG: NAD-dependent epimerase/dehydratase family protein [Candidatus Hodarchaeales archaeon]|jgi:UDP-glucose 4-epimerase
MNVVVFGGSGFLGSHVSDALTTTGHDVTIFDLVPSQYLHKTQKMITGNILDKKAVEKVVKRADVVYNFAGVADILEAKENPLKTVELNILGNTIILEACRKNDIKRFVFASSLYVYSQTGSFYRSSKQACELIIEDYYRAYGLPFTILRYGSLFGPRADERNWIYKILKQALTEGKITRYGDGEEIREYIHVEDAARCSVDVLSKEFENQRVVITGNQQMKIKDLLIMIKEIFNNEIKIEFQPSDSDMHYEITPYSFSPKIAQKITMDRYFDLGQGIMHVLEGIHKELFDYYELPGVLVNKKTKKK